MEGVRTVQVFGGDFPAEVREAVMGDMDARTIRRCAVWVARLGLNAGLREGKIHPAVEVVARAAAAVTGMARLAGGDAFTASEMEALYRKAFSKQGPCHMARNQSHKGEWHYRLYMTTVAFAATGHPDAATALSVAVDCVLKAGVTPAAVAERIRSVRRLSQ